MQKQELALQYFPDLERRSAVRHLVRDIERCSELHRLLLNHGYNSRQKSFTYRQVLLIKQYLGEP